MSNWYNYDIKSRKALILLMERSKRPTVVTAGKILDLSLETFTTVSYNKVKQFKANSYFLIFSRF